MTQQNTLSRQIITPVGLVCWFVLLLGWVSPIESLQAADGQSCFVSSLPEIGNTDLRATLSTFLRSCDKYREVGPDKLVGPGYAGPRPFLDYQQLMQVCTEAKGLMLHEVGQQEVLAFLDRHFEAIKVTTDKSSALLTAYYEPSFPISRKKVVGVLDWPLYSKPDNIPSSSWLTRQAIETGEADETLRGKILFYTDRWSAYVLHVQGSGTGVLPDGSRVRLIYSAKNGRGYSSIGRVLVDRGEIPEDQISMSAIKAWLADHSKAEQDALYWRNESFVFFTINTTARDESVGPPGAMNLSGGLTPYRSVAVDWAHYVPGLPLYVVGKLGNGQELHQLVVAQDRGGAITSGVRVDLFLGSGQNVADIAGSTRDEKLQLWMVRFREGHQESSTIMGDGYDQGKL